MVGEYNIKVGQSSPIRLAFWVELGPEPCCCGLQWTWLGKVPTRGYSGSGRIPLRHSNICPSTLGIVYKDDWKPFISQEMASSRNVRRKMRGSRK
jgi:hypothetical protein